MFRFIDGNGGKLIFQRNSAIIAMQLEYFKCKAIPRFFDFPLDLSFAGNRFISSLPHLMGGRLLEPKFTEEYGS